MEDSVLSGGIARQYSPGRSHRGNFEPAIAQNSCVDIDNATRALGWPGARGRFACI